MGMRRDQADLFDLSMISTYLCSTYRGSTVVANKPFFIIIFIINNTKNSELLFLRCKQRIRNERGCMPNICKCSIHRCA